VELSYEKIHDLWSRLRAENQQRNGEYDIARQRVDGKLWGDATLPIPENRYSIALNYLLPITQKHVQLLMGRMPGIQCPPVGTSMEEREQAERLEGVLYSSWYLSNAHELFQRVAYDSFVLRRGVVYYWWDAKNKRARFRYVTPDNYYPEYDGEDTYRAIYTHRRHLGALQSQYPKFQNDIVADPPADVENIYLQDQPRQNQTEYVTVLDYYDIDGNWVRLAGDLILDKKKLGYPEPEVPFVEFPYLPASGNREPRNGIDQLVELVQYLSQLVSQKADVIRTYANPTILDEMSGQSPDEIRSAVAADGSVIPLAKQGNIRFLNWEGTTPTIDEQIQLIMDAIFDISGKPRSAFGQTVTNQSGVVTNLALTPTLQSNEAHETLWGRRLSHLNRRLLQLTEKFGTEKMHYRGLEPIGNDHRGYRAVNLEFSGKEIGGWYESRIKWPSAIRTDDPVYVQNQLSQLTADPPSLSLYTALEELGREDVEAEIDRILEQKEDPRLSAGTVSQNVNTALEAGPGGVPAELLGAPEAGAPPDIESDISGDALQESASPAREQLS
jgi:hypothetical protein